jgi:hypothetical protein
MIYVLSARTNFLYDEPKYAFCALIRGSYNDASIEPYYIASNDEMQYIKNHNMCAVSTTLIIMRTCFIYAHYMFRPEGPLSGA